MGTLETVFPLCKQKSCSQFSFCSALATLQARPASRLVVSVTASGWGWSEVPAVTPAGHTFLPVKLPGTAPGLVLPVWNNRRVSGIYLWYIYWVLCHWTVLCQRSLFRQ